MSEGRIIGLVSGKGGVGKTSLTVNLAVGLKQLGKEVTVVDTDFSASNIGVHLGQYDHPVKIHDVLHQQAEPQSAIFRHSTGIKAMIASNEINTVEPDTSMLKYTLESAAQDSDYVLVDCPPGLDTTVESIMAACNELMIVTMPTRTATTNAAQIVEKAKRMHKPVLGTVINMSEQDPEKELVEREVEMMTESNIIGEISHDQTMKESLFHNKPILKHEPLSPAALDIKQLAADIDGTEFERPAFANIKRKFKNFRKSISK